MGTRDALVSDRPDFTESASTIAAHHVQVEGGQTTSREGDTRSNAVGEVLVRAGLGKRVELRAAGNSWVRENTGGIVTSGREDASLGFKFAIADGPDAPSWRPALALITATSIPSGTNAFRSTRAQPEMKAIAAWTLSSRVGFASNLNVARPFDGVRSFTEYSGSGSFAFALTERVGSYAEAFAFAPQDGSGTVNKYVNGGLTFLFSPDVQLDVRGGVGPSARARDYFAGVGLVVRR
jgi:hypothetical protein